MEVTILILVIVCQLVAMMYAWRGTQRLKLLVPSRAELRVGSLNRALAPEGEADPESQVDPTSTTRAHYLLESDAIPSILVDEPSESFAQIVKDLNGYAYANQGAASDFALVKDVVDRPVDAAIGRAEAWVSVPLYIGLAGALTGIIFGVRAMSQGVLAKAGAAPGADDGSASMDLLTGNLGDLLNAVGWAMGASLTGVIFTLILSGITAAAVKTLDERRNQFFTFYQIEFLPRITRDVNSVLASLNGTLDRFNTQFGGNVEAMQASFRENTKAIEAQARTLQAMRELSVGGALEKTIDLYRGLEQAIKTIDALQPHIERSSAMMKMVGDASERFVNAAGSAERLTKISTDIAELTRASHEIQAFVARHITDLQSGSDAALGIGQRIVEGFDTKFDGLTQQLTRLNQALLKNVEVVQRASAEVKDQAASKLENLPNELDGMIQGAFDAKTVRAIKDSADQASRAATETQLEASTNKEIREDIFKGLETQRRAVDRTIQRLDEVAAHMNMTNAAMNRLLNPLPWYKRIFSGKGPYGSAPI